MKAIWETLKVVFALTVIMMAILFVLALYALPIYVSIHFEIHSWYYFVMSFLYYITLSMIVITFFKE